VSPVYVSTCVLAYVRTCLPVHIKQKQARAGMPV